VDRRKSQDVLEKRLLLSLSEIEICFLFHAALSLVTTPTELTAIIVTAFLIRYGLIYKKTPIFWSHQCNLNTISKTVHGICVKAILLYYVNEALLGVVLVTN